MNTCRECKHWESVDKTCARGFCDYATEQPMTPGGFQSADGWTAILTGPDFGCVHFAEKHSAHNPL